MTSLFAMPVPVLAGVPAADVVSLEAHLMGGRVGVHLRLARSPQPGEGSEARARRDAARTLRRIGHWADRLTRFSPASELSRLNDHPAAVVPVRPTLAAVLGEARLAGRESRGIVDPTLLDARLAAEDPDRGSGEAPARGTGTWSLRPRRRGAIVERTAGTRFDLGGVAKGWIADRAARALEAHPAVLVDADGDLAIALAYREQWRIAVADPRGDGPDLAVLELAGLDPRGRQRYGLATSGTSVHRWAHGDRIAHHLIDPRTGRPAVTDVVQATVLADSAARAEAAAKTIVILGSEQGGTLMDRPGIRAVIILTTDGRVLASPSALRWLA